MGWRWVTATQYCLVAGGRYVRQIKVREPQFNEPDGTKYCLSGHGRESIYGSLDEAVEAAEASLDPDDSNP
jgi:hypothetical protein